MDLGGCGAAELRLHGGAEERRPGGARCVAGLGLVVAEEGRRVPGGPWAVVKKGRARIAAG